MKYLIPYCILGYLILCTINSQAKSTTQLKENDSLNMEAVKNRPLSNLGQSNIAIGGYLEAHWQYYSTEGESKGHQFLLPRMSLFISSSISERIQFLSEVELEDGGNKIGIEFAALDLQLHPFINLRGGIIMNPIGAFNQNHDGPKWEFAERPIAMNQMLAATWSTIGFGSYGKFAKNQWVYAYEAYISGGFDESIIDNTEGKTFLPASKKNIERFNTISSGLPSFTGKISIKNRKIGELGLSYMGGIYNKIIEEGEEVASKMPLHIAAIDFNTKLKWGTKIITEIAYINLETPEYITPEYGNAQWGGYIDIIQPIYRGEILNWKQSVLQLALRLEYVDWNIGRMTNYDNTIKGEEMWSIMPGISYRPNDKTVIRASYRFRRDYDFLKNPGKNTGGFTFGISSYF